MVGTHKLSQARESLNGQLTSEKLMLAMWVATNESPRDLGLYRTKLSLEEAELACDVLNRRGLKVNPYDFPGTAGVWQSSDAAGVPYTQVATRELIDALGRYEGVDPATPEGFREILKWCTIDSFRFEPINQHGTTLSGMISRPWFSSSPSRPVFEVIENDPAFKDIKKIGLTVWDFPEAPNSLWKASDGGPTLEARLATKELIKSLADNEGVSYRSCNGFAKILKSLHRNTFITHPINYWGTTLGGMLTHAYGGSAVRAVLDLVNNDSDFHHVRRAGLSPYDFPKAPQNTWIDKNGRPTFWARHATAALLTAIAANEGVNPLTRQGFLKVIKLTDKSAFRSVPINRWGTRLSDMLRDAYNYDPKAALLDLVKHDPRFKGFAGDLRRLYSNSTKS